MEITYFINYFVYRNLKLSITSKGVCSYKIKSFKRNESVSKYRCSRGSALIPGSQPSQIRFSLMQYLFSMNAIKLKKFTLECTLEKYVSDFYGIHSNYGGF